MMSSDRCCSNGSTIQAGIELTVLAKSLAADISLDRGTASQGHSLGIRTRWLTPGFETLWRPLTT